MSVLCFLIRRVRGILRGGAQGFEVPQEWVAVVDALLTKGGAVSVDEVLLCLSTKSYEEQMDLLFGWRRPDVPEVSFPCAASSLSCWFQADWEGGGGEGRVPTIVRPRSPFPARLDRTTGWRPSTRQLESEQPGRECPRSTRPRASSPPRASRSDGPDA